MHRIVYPFYASSILVHGARADPVRVAKPHRDNIMHVGGSGCRKPRTNLCPFRITVLRLFCNQDTAVQFCHGAPVLGYFQQN